MHWRNILAYFIELKIYEKKISNVTGPFFERKCLLIFFVLLFPLEIAECTVCIAIMNRDCDYVAHCAMFQILRIYLPAYGEHSRSVMSYDHVQRIYGDYNYYYNNWRESQMKIHDIKIVLVVHKIINFQYLVPFSRYI